MCGGRVGALWLLGCVNELWGCSVWEAGEGKSSILREGAGTPSCRETRNCYTAAYIRGLLSVPENTPLWYMLVNPVFSVFPSCLKILPPLPLPQFLTVLSCVFLLPPILAPPFCFSLPRLSPSLPSSSPSSSGDHTLLGYSWVNWGLPPRRDHRNPPWALHVPLTGPFGLEDPPTCPSRGALLASPRHLLCSKDHLSCLPLLLFASWRPRAAKGIAYGHRSNANTP